MRALLADVVLVTHLCLAAFIVLGLVAVWTYGLHAWAWTRNFRFRLVHACAIGVVALESLLGIRCPLTTWEDALRGDAVAAGFVQRWASRILYYDIPETIFAAVYVAAAAATAIAWIRIPPLRKVRKRSAATPRRE